MSLRKSPDRGKTICVLILRLTRTVGDSGTVDFAMA